MILFCFLILYCWESNLYSRFLSFAFCYLLSILYNWESNLQYPFLLGSVITGLIALSPFWPSFSSTRSPLSPPSPFSSLPNSLNLFVCSRLWRTLRELITGWISLSPFDSPFSPPAHLCLLPPSSLLYVTPWTSLRDADCGEHIGILARLLSPLLIPPLLLLVTSISLSLFSSPCNSVNLWVSFTVENLFTINLDVLSSMLYGWRSLEATARIRLKTRGRRLKPQTWKHQRAPDSREP